MRTETPPILENPAAVIGLMVDTANSKEMHLIFEDIHERAKEIFDQFAHSDHAQETDGKGSYSPLDTLRAKHIELSQDVDEDCLDATMTQILLEALIEEIENQTSED
tara:strand:+ start:533 stop:853 length:321 start_codon:yes stop_codon:yes gene_type:complete